MLSGGTQALRVVCEESLALGCSWDSMEKKVTSGMSVINLLFPYIKNNLYRAGGAYLKSSVKNAEAGVSLCSRAAWSKCTAN